jgi:hypothetical protein
MERGLGGEVMATKVMYSLIFKQALSGLKVFLLAWGFEPQVELPGHSG